MIFYNGIGTSQDKEKEKLSLQYACQQITWIRELNVKFESDPASKKIIMDLQHLRLREGRMDGGHIDGRMD